jgi:hypothetical protein
MEKFLQDAIDIAAKELRIAKNSLSYKSACEAVENMGVMVVTGKHTGSGRYAGSTSWTFDTLRLLDKAGFVAIHKNIAPKGGRAGERVMVSSYQQGRF